MVGEGDIASLHCCPHPLRRYSVIRPDLLFAGKGRPWTALKNLLKIRFAKKMESCGVTPWKDAGGSIPTQGGPQNGAWTDSSDGGTDCSHDAMLKYIAFPKRRRAWSWGVAKIQVVRLRTHVLG
jgi:hypothetical protein